MSTFTPVIPASTGIATDLHRWAAQHDRLHVDLGTGDGRYAIDRARRSPGTAVVGIDTSLDHLRGAKRRYPSNSRFIRRDACVIPDGYLPAAAGMTINFPYGSLLRGLVEGAPGLIAGIDATLGAGGRIEVRLNRTAFVATGLDPDTGPTAVARHLRLINGLDITLRELTQPELRTFPSSWSKRLGFGREAGATLVEGTRRTGR